MTTGIFLSLSSFIESWYIRLSSVSSNFKTYVGHFDAGYFPVYPDSKIGCSSVARNQGNMFSDPSDLNEPQVYVGKLTKYMLPSLLLWIFEVYLCAKHSFYKHIILTLHLVVNKS